MFQLPKAVEPPPGPSQVELDGLIPPWVVDRLCAACKAAQGGAFRAVLDTLPASGCLNVSPPAGSVAGQARAAPDGVTGCVSRRNAFVEDNHRLFSPDAPCGAVFAVHTHVLFTRERVCQRVANRLEAPVCPPRSSQFEVL